MRQVKKKHRSVFRHLLFMILYQYEVQKGHTTIDEILDGFLKNKNNRYIKALRERAKEIVSCVDFLDSIIDKYSEYPPERIQLSDRIILRMALFDMIYNHIPEEIAISEALKIANKFSNPLSAKFINGLLGRFVREGLTRENGENKGE